MGKTSTSAQDGVKATDFTFPSKTDKMRERVYETVF